MSSPEASPNHAPLLSADEEVSTLRLEDDTLSHSKLDYHLPSESSLRVASNNEDLKKVIRDEIAAGLRYNDDQVEQGMQERLALFGFQENQIQALLHPNPQRLDKVRRDTRMTPESHVHIESLPTYPKIHNKHLDVQTLHYYDIPYEIDTDPGYFIILHEMNQKVIDVLFEHTRRLRSHI
jgi:hypothetical protein